MRYWYPISPFVCSVILATSLSSCGHSDDLPTSLPQPVQISPITQATGLQEVLKNLEEINSRLARLESGSTPSSTAAPTSTSSSTSASSFTTETSTNQPAPQETKPDRKEQGRQILTKLLNVINNAAFIDASVEKYERELDDGSISTNKLRFMAKQGGSTVRINVLESSSGSKGVKLRYTSGVGDSAKVRPAGALSFLTTDLKKADDRLASQNGYILDDTDFFGMAKRMSDSSYEAELIGATTMGGERIHVLKVTTTGQNSLDPRITHEYIGFEPETLKLRLWEAYEGSSKEAFYRLSLLSFDIPPSIPENAFKL